MPTVTQTGPYKDTTINHIYELLFCDKPQLFMNEGNKDTPPFNIVLAKDPTAAALQQIAADNTADPRVRLLAFYKQLASGQPVSQKELIGVIVEVGLDEGLDVLACYNNCTARYINHTGSLLVWETSEDETANRLISELFQNSITIVDRIGPWDQPRKPHPPKGMTRISFLVSDGLYFGEAPTHALFSDPMAGPALSNATAILQYITNKTLQK